MKHVFLVNNHIVYLMTKKIIDYKKISKEDILLLSVRHYVFPDDSGLSEIVKVSYEFFSFFNFSSICWMLSTLVCRESHCLKPIREADEMIKQFIGKEPFLLYAYHCNSFNVEILASMPQCQELNYVEEGTLAYMSTLQNDMVKQTFLRTFDLCLKRYLTNGRYGYPFKEKHFDIDYPKFRSIYCCCDESFRGYPNKIVLGFPFPKMDTVPDDLSAVLVFDGGAVPFEQQLKSNEISVQHFAKHHPGGTFYYKFHPGQNEEVKEKYRSQFLSLEKEYGISIRELSSKIVLERLIATLQNRMDLYVICSSVGLYGLMGGARVFTTAKHFITVSPLLRKHYKTYGQILSRYIEI